MAQRFEEGRLRGAPGQQRRAERGRFGGGSGVAVQGGLPVQGVSSGGKSGGQSVQAERRGGGGGGAERGELRAHAGSTSGQQQGRRARVGVEKRLLPPRVRALQQGAEAIAGLSFGKVRKGQGSLALGIRVGGLLVAAAIVAALIHALHLDYVRVDGLVAARLYLRAGPIRGRHLHNTSSSAVLCVLHLLKGRDGRGDAELRDVVRGDDIRTEGNPFDLVAFFSKHDVRDFEAELCGRDGQV